MKDQDIIKAIAELDGWTCINSPDAAFIHGDPPDGSERRSIPDYLHDLNAMHEAEKSLTEEQHGLYSRHLREITKADWKVTGGGQTVVGVIYFYLIHATAAQRAKAFLRTIGKWKD